MKSLRIFIFTPFQFNDNYTNIKEKIVLKTNENPNIMYEKGWFLLDKNNPIKYKKHIFDVVNTINRERNLNLYLYDKSLLANKTKYSTFNIELKTFFVSNESYNFLKITELNFTDISSDLNIEKIFNSKDVIGMFGLTELYYKANSICLDIIHTLLSKISIEINAKRCFKITKDSGYPLLIANGLDKIQYNNIFSKQENYNQRHNNSAICKDFKDSYIHLGWDYSVVTNVSQAINQSLFCAVTYLQMYYYQLRFYKKFFIQNIDKLSKVQIINEYDVEKFEQLKLTYQRYLLKYKTYKSGLTPIIYEEFVKVENLWHINEDIDLIQSTFVVQKEYIDKKYQISNEKLNKSVNFGLAIIALLQIATIFSTALDFFELKRKYPAMYINTFYIILILTIMLLPYVLKPVFLYLRRLLIKKIL